MPVAASTATKTQSSPLAPSLDAVRKGKAVIEIGEHGKSVRKLQGLMNDAFEHQHIQVDGTFGNAMKQRLVQFQGNHDLKATGRLNKQTLKRIEAKATPALSDKGATPWGAGLHNGYLPDGKMRDIPGPGDFKLWPQAAQAFTAMYRAAHQDGLNLGLTGSYRSYAAQVLAHQNKPTLTVAPGTSVHGWGMAVDVSTADQWSEKFAWLKRHAADYGFKGITDGSNAWAAEAWHWEYSPNARWNPPG